MSFPLSLPVILSWVFQGDCEVKLVIAWSLFHPAEAKCKTAWSTRVHFHSWNGICVAAKAGVQIVLHLNGHRIISASWHMAAVSASHPGNPGWDGEPVPQVPIGDVPRVLPPRHPSMLPDPQPRCCRVWAAGGTSAEPSSLLLQYFRGNF